MSDETPEIEPTESEEKPKRRRRKTPRAPKEPAGASSSPEQAEAPSTAEPALQESEEQPESVSTRVARPADEAPPVEAETAGDIAPQADQEQEPEAPADRPEAEATEPETGEGQPEPEADEQPAGAPAAPRDRRAATPAQRRRRRRGERLDVEVRAQAKYVRSSARKARLVCDHIRGKSVEEARAILAHTPRAIARDWSKLLESAVANAEHNHELIGEDLYIKAVRADEGPTIKRYRPRALGRATRIRKRTSHLTILLTPKP
jgi:ribosomal protein L22